MIKRLRAQGVDVADVDTGGAVEEDKAEAPMVSPSFKSSFSLAHG